MKFCASCNAQFPDEMDRCVHCGGRLQDSFLGTSPDDVQLPPVEKLFLLSSYQPPFTRRLADRLQEADIPFHIEVDPGADRADERFGSSGREVRLQLYVRPEDREDAEALQAQLIRDRVPDIPDEFAPDLVSEGVCPACSSAVAEGDVECPDCGLAFPEN